MDSVAKYVRTFADWAICVVGCGCPEWHSAFIISHKIPQSSYSDYVVHRFHNDVSRHVRIRSRRKKGRIPSPVETPLDSWSATSVHIARGNTRPDLKIRLGLRVQSRLPSPNRASPLRRFSGKQRTTTLPRPQRQRVGLFRGLGGYRAHVALFAKKHHCRRTWSKKHHCPVTLHTSFGN